MLPVISPDDTQALISIGTFHFGVVNAKFSLLILLLSCHRFLHLCAKESQVCVFFIFLGKSTIHNS